MDNGEGWEKIRGEVIVRPVTGFSTAVVVGELCALRLSTLPPPPGFGQESNVLQFGMSPKIALEIGRALVAAGEAALGKGSTSRPH